MHLGIHRNADQFLFVGRQLIRDVLQEDESAKIHQEFAEEQRRSARLLFNDCRDLGIGAIIIRRLNGFDGFEYSVFGNERSASAAAPDEALLLHLFGFKAPQQIEEILGVASHQSAGKPHNAIRA